MQRHIQDYFLYGEAQRDVPADFLHLENLDERSRPSGWNIRAHAHAALAHVLFITSGSGVMSADGVTSSFTAPALLLVPARVVHAFGWQPDTQGHVLTFSANFLTRLLAAIPEISGLFDTAAHITVPADGCAAGGLEQVLGRVARELAWPAPARDRMLQACLTALLLDVWRLHVTARDTGHHLPRAGMRLASRYLATLEAGFRQPRRMSSYADELGAQPAMLRAATRAVTGRSPSALLRERQILEAKRLLLYSNVSIAEAAYTLGFTDPAYFSRAFRNATGQSPRAFRRLGVAQAST